MRVVVQRTKDASCDVEGKIVGSISEGLLLLVGFTEGDTIDNIQELAQKVIHLRIFDDENGIMNKNILEDSNRKILSISQFTLYADTKKGNRPSYLQALNGKEASILYEKWNEELRKYISVETGIFGSNMQIHFTNDGPVTILLER